jgi:hypothetical protein
MAVAVNINIACRLEVLTTVVMKSPVFWDITPCRPFIGQIDVSQENKASSFRVEAKQETSVKQAASQVRKWRPYISLKYRLTFNKLEVYPRGQNSSLKLHVTTRGLRIKW